MDPSGIVRDVMLSCPSIVTLLPITQFLYTVNGPLVTLSPRTAPNSDLYGTTFDIHQAGCCGNGSVIRKGTPFTDHGVDNTGM